MFFSAARIPDTDSLTSDTSFGLLEHWPEKSKLLGMPEADPGWPQSDQEPE